MTDKRRLKLRLGREDFNPTIAPHAWVSGLRDRARRLTGLKCTWQSNYLGRYSSKSSKIARATLRGFVSRRPPWRLYSAWTLTASW
jgi:hypothetical protein